jgi:hypothetical protein
VALHADNYSRFDASRAGHFAAITDGLAKSSGIAVGEAAANVVLALRAEDGSSAMTSYMTGTRPGECRSTPPDFAPTFRPRMCLWPRLESRVVRFETGVQHS